MHAASVKAGSRPQCSWEKAIDDGHFPGTNCDPEW